MKSAFLFWFLAGYLAAQSASMEGTVTNHANGQPVPDVHISLVTGDFAGNGGPEKSYAATTDRAGHFSFEKLEPGAYVMILRRNGFVQAAAGNLPIQLLSVKPGEHVSGKKFEMQQRATISGRVVDDDGEPVQHANVTVKGVPPDRDPTMGFGQIGFSETDDRGEFRLTAPPGRFLVQVQPRQDNVAFREIRTDGSSPAPYSATFYPGTAEKEQAGVVEAGAGQDVGGLLIHLVRTLPNTPGHALTLSGQVTGIPEGGHAIVTLVYGDKPDAMHQSRSTTISADGKFTIGGLEPKYYRVSAQDNTGKVRLQSPAMELHLGTQDVSGIQLALAPGEELSGQVELSGAPEGAAIPNMKVTLEAVNFDNWEGRETSAVTGKDGSLHVANLFPNKYRVRVDGLPEDAYLKQVTLDGKVAKDNTIELAGIRGSRLKVTVVMNGARISGKLLGHDGAPLVSPLTMVMIWKGGADEDPETLRVSVSQYAAKGLRPGKIRILAVDIADVLDQIMDNENAINKQAYSAAEEVELKDGEQLTKDLQVVDKEKLHAPKK